jgi:membrane protein involved in colicin uptake
VNSFGLNSEVGIEPQLNTQSEYRISLRKDTDSPQSVEGQRFVNELVAKLSPEAAQYRQSIEAKVKAEIELKAQLEAEAVAKAAVELKAKQEADAKAAAELKTKQDREAKAVALKKTTITCIKGKLTKKVIAIKPKCPIGYKKK